VLTVALSLGRDGLHRRGRPGAGRDAAQQGRRVAVRTDTAPHLRPRRVLRSAAGRQYQIRVTGDWTTVTALGPHGEPQLQTFGALGRYAAPQVVPGGPPEGSSPDGRWLVLEAQTPAPQETSNFLVLTSELQREHEPVVLPGHFTFDAWSPSGDVLYLVEHKPPAGSGHYVVRAYDMKTQSLRPQPVADKRNLEEEMAGQPVARAATADGAVVATLYVRPAHDDGTATSTAPSSTSCTPARARLCASTCHRARMSARAGAPAHPRRLRPHEAAGDAGVPHRRDERRTHAGGMSHGRSPDPATGGPCGSRASGGAVALWHDQLDGGRPGPRVTRRAARRRHGAAGPLRTSGLLQAGSCARCPSCARVTPFGTVRLYLN
jgi:hypothetical protein